METAADPIEALRDAVLLAALPNVVFDGWSVAALNDGARDVGLSDFDVARAFPGGEAEAVAHFADWADRQMLAAAAAADLPSMKVRARVHFAVRARLEALAPYKEAVRRAVGFCALPAHCALGPKTLYDTVDAVWFAAGDASTDYNFYTKRALLAGVTTATTLYWLEDVSDDHADTWAFLDRALNGVTTLGRTLSGVGGSVGKAAALLGHFPSPTRFLRRLREAGAASGASGGLRDGHPSA